MTQTLAQTHDKKATGAKTVLAMSCCQGLFAHPSVCQDYLVRIQPLSLADRLAVKSWNYPQELDTYSGEEIAPDSPGFFAVYDGDSFIGFGVTGFPAIVQGLELTSTDLDVGLGMAPNFIRNGRSREFSQTVLEYANSVGKENGFNYLRCAIYSWNTVPQLMAKRAGFQPTGRITNDLASSSS